MTRQQWLIRHRALARRVRERNEARLEAHAMSASIAIGCTCSSCRRRIVESPKANPKTDMTQFYPNLRRKV